MQIVHIAQTMRPALVLFVALSIVTGLVYPAVVTGVGAVAFADQARGSLVVRDGRVVGSSLIGQSFVDPAHFWGRPSATAPQPDNASASSGSNLGPLNPALVDAVAGRIAALKAADRQAGVSNDAPIPIDLVTASGSGLDPHISPAAAAYQAARVAAVTGIPLERVRALIAAHTDGPQLGFLGMPRVDVLSLDLAVDEARATADRAPRPMRPGAS